MGKDEEGRGGGREGLRVFGSQYSSFIGLCLSTREKGKNKEG